ncbi:MAG: hypothetical protein EBR40_02145 [Proteobacteria bacterium]|nr:hypothetical protein [Pseudomonadota bacterium]
MRIFLLGIVFIATTSVLTAQDLPAPQNSAALLRELDQINKTAETHEQQRRSEAISRIQSAAASPSASVELYLQALAGTKYLDKHQDFLDWKQKNQDVIRHSSYQNAAQLQLRYLLLGLLRSEKHDALAQINETLAYLNSLQSLHFLDEPFVAPPTQKGYQPQPCPSDKVTKEAADLMGKSLLGYPIVEWLQIKDLLPDKDFSGAAGDYFEILEKNVKSPLKQKNDPRLTGVWDLQITTAMTHANATKDSQKAVTFKTEKLPNLLFGKCADMAAIGQPNRAVNEMVALIRAYPGNPSVPDWIEAAKHLITNTPVAPTSGTNAPDSTAAATNVLNSPEATAPQTNTPTQSR